MRTIIWTTEKRMAIDSTLLVLTVGGKLRDFDTYFIVAFGIFVVAGTETRLGILFLSNLKFMA